LFSYIHGGPKKLAHFLHALTSYALTSSNIDRFSDLFHSLNQKSICNKIVSKDPSTPVNERRENDQQLKREEIYCTVFFQREGGESVLPRRPGEGAGQRVVRLVPRVPAVGDALSDGRSLVSVRRSTLRNQVRVEDTREQGAERQCSAAAVHQRRHVVRNQRRVGSRR